MADYNPLRIKESLKEIELAVTQHGFKGVYVLIELAAECGEETEGGIFIHARLSRAELAEMTGLSRETVSLILSELAAKGLITTQKQKITLCDQAGLRGLL